MMCAVRSVDYIRTSVSIQAKFIWFVSNEVSNQLLSVLLLSLSPGEGRGFICIQTIFGLKFG